MVNDWSGENGQDILLSSEQSACKEFVGCQDGSDAGDNGYVEEDVGVSDIVGVGQQERSPSQLHCREAQGEDDTHQTQENNCSVCVMC